MYTGRGHGLLRTGHLRYCNISLTSSRAATIINDNLYIADGWNGDMDENKVWSMSKEVWLREGITSANK